MAKEKKKGWFSKIESREDAIKVVKDTSMGFFVVAALQAALSFLVGFSVLVDAVLYVVGGFILRRFNSRVAAVALLILAILGVIVTFANKFGDSLGGGSNIFLALIVLWAAIRAVEATFKLCGKYRAAVVPDEPIASQETPLK